jgi:hypothetical protein
MFEEIDTVTDAEVFQTLGRYITGKISVAESAIELSVDPETVRNILNRHDIEVRERSRHEIVEEVADCFISAEDDPMMDNDYQFDYEDRLVVEGGVSDIIEQINVDTDQFRITEGRLRREIKDFLWEAKTDDGDTNDVFWSRMDDIYRYLGTQDRSKYNIVFPLNVLYSDVDRPDEYRVLNETIHALSSDEWISCCFMAYEHEQQKADESDAIGSRNDLEHRFENSPNELGRPDQTYWMMEIEALEAEYALRRCVDVLQFLLGRINFAVTSNRTEGGQMNSSVWNTRWMDLRQPFVYLVFEDNEYSYYSYSTDPTPRRPIKLSAHKARQYRNHLDDVPPLNTDRNSMEDHLVKALYSFQDAVTSTYAEDAFLNYWQGLERLTLTSKTDTTSTVIKRARTVESTATGARESEVAEKRNKLVHEGDSVEITTDDTNILKLMLDGLIREYVEKSSDWGYEEFVFFFEHGSKSDAALDQLEQQRETEIDLIDEMR